MKHRRIREIINIVEGEKSNGSPFTKPSSYCTVSHLNYSPISVLNHQQLCGTLAENGTHTQCGGAHVLSVATSTNQHPSTQPIVVIHPRQKDPYFGSTNCSPYPVKYNGKEYPTSDHLFQAFKYMDHRPDIADKIRTTSQSSKEASKVSTAYAAHQSPEWDRMCVANMENALWHKFNQNMSLKKQLLEAGDAHIIVSRNHTRNELWGLGKTLTGGNELGKVLERVRAGLRTS
ncbi:hypothetical protein C8R43DRAFT_907893 [Mycena crocata]|nr:hypothetical protein C8R43DRAFT_907893 [Mycena crocata]